MKICWTSSIVRLYAVGVFIISYVSRSLTEFNFFFTNVIVVSRLVTRPYTITVYRVVKSIYVSTVFFLWLIFICSLTISTYIIVNNWWIGRYFIWAKTITMNWRSSSSVHVCNRTWVIKPSIVVWVAIVSWIEPRSVHIMSVTKPTVWKIVPRIVRTVIRVVKRIIPRIHIIRSVKIWPIKTIIWIVTIINNIPYHNK